jgi:hypothetical protein
VSSTAARPSRSDRGRTLRQQGEVSSWLRIYAYELALLRALAARASDDPVALVRALAVADGHLSQLANSDPATILARRRANLAALAP